MQWITAPEIAASGLSAIAAGLMLLWAWWRYRVPDRVALVALLLATGIWSVAETRGWGASALPAGVAPLAFAISVVALASGLLRFRFHYLLSALTPVERDVVVEGFPDGILVLDGAGRIVDLNQAGQRILGQPAAAVLGKRPGSVLAAWPELALDQAGLPLRVEFALSNGAIRREYELWATPLRHRRGRLVVLREITERKRAEHDLRESERRYRALFENASEIIYTVDLNGNVTSMNRAGEQVLGYPLEEVLHLNIGDLMTPESLNLTREMLGRKLAGGGVTTYEIEARAKHDLRVPLEVSSRLIYRGAQPVGIQSIARDVTERRRWEEALRHQALHDALTDLPNRTLLDDRLQQTILAAQRDGTCHALLVMDLDRFKEVNDTFGHHCGDLVLQQIGPRLKRAMRATDSIARLGGDEFAILLHGVDLDGAKLVARQLLEALEPPFTVEVQRLEIGASLGIALYPQHGVDAATLLRRADVAMYVAKRTNSGYAVYAVEQDENSPSRLALAGELRSAINLEQLMLHYQPLVDMRTGRVVRLEALARWQHPRQGLILPDQFIPLAEQTGLIKPLSVSALGMALRQCRLWREAGWDIGVAVNLSARNLHDPRLPYTIAELESAYGVLPEWLTVEITESSLMADPPRALENLSSLRDMGVGVAVDDFGTGYSSLSYLKRLPVDEIKIDKSFVLHMAVDENDAAIVRSTTSLGHDLGLQVVAEGVEDAATWDLLRAHGCDVAQGYFVSRPIPAADIGRWLAETSWTARPALRA